MTTARSPLILTFVGVAVIAAILMVPAAMSNMQTDNSSYEKETSETGLYANAEPFNASEQLFGNRVKIGEGQLPTITLGGKAIVIPVLQPDAEFEVAVPDITRGEPDPYVGQTMDFRAEPMWEWDFPWLFMTSAAPNALFGSNGEMKILDVTGGHDLTFTYKGEVVYVFEDYYAYPDPEVDIYIPAEIYTTEMLMEQLAWEKFYAWGTEYRDVISQLLTEYDAIAMDGCILYS